MTTPKLRIAFAGTPKLARVTLESLINKDIYDIKVVFTQPDRPSGRGKKLTQSEVKECAIKHHIPVSQPVNSKDIDINILKDCDLLLVVAYGIILPEDVLNTPKFGCINIHTSLLPRWRGAAPIRRAIEAGDKESGITFIQMDTGLDTGPVLMQEKCLIYDNDTGDTLYDRLAEISANSVHILLDKLNQGTITPVPQKTDNICYANKITKEEAHLNWNESAVVLERKIRAFNPNPVTYTTINNIDLRVWEASVKPCKDVDLKPGTIIKGSKTSIDVVTSQDIISITKIQLPGKRVMDVKDFLNGRPNFFDHTS